MTLGDIVAIVAAVIATLSLLVSLVTAYLTLWSGFRGSVLPRRRPMLHQMDGMPCLVLECEFVNDGARPGSVEDMLVEFRPDTGSGCVFLAYKTRDEFNIYHTYQPSDFSIFSGISIGARQRRELCVMFKPNDPSFRPSAGNVVLVTKIAVDSGSKRWVVSPTSLSLDLREDVVARWASPDGTSQQVMAVEIVRRREAYLRRRDGWLWRWLERRGLI